MTTTQILMLLTSHSVLGASGGSTGFWLEELSDPIAVFRGRGFEVEVASIVGGAAPIDPVSAGADTSNVPDLDALVAATMPIAEVDPGRYGGVFLVGGHGTMWDFADNEQLARVVAGIGRRGVIGAVCHGVAGLLGVNAEDGQPLVRARMITAFSDAEEEAVGATAVIPFSLEQRLRQAGALVEVDAAFAPHTRRDGSLITGQNPQSAEATAVLMVEAMAEQTRGTR